MTFTFWPGEAFFPWRVVLVQFFLHSLCCRNCPRVLDPKAWSEHNIVGDALHHHEPTQHLSFGSPVHPKSAGKLPPLQENMKQTGHSVIPVYFFFFGQKWYKVAVERQLLSQLLPRQNVSNGLINSTEAPQDLIYGTLHGQTRSSYSHLVLW